MRKPSLKKTASKVTQSFQAWVAERSLRIHQALSHYLEGISYPAPKLQEAMAYAVLNGGKRIRPLLIYAAGEIFEATLESLDLAALAIELIHSYSLIHDDLPAMDNAEWRRGKPSCFKTFGEDLAILAGDALQALAFEIITTHPAPLSAEERLLMVQILSRASGPSGMVSGQTLDIFNKADSAFSESELIQLYQLKTGALIQASIHMALIAAPLSTLEEQKMLEQYAEQISLAFQIQDDILDKEGKKESLGKPAGLDQAQQKITYPHLKGLETAKQTVETLFQQAYQALEPLGTKAAFLRQLTEYVGKRDK